MNKSKFQVIVADCPWSFQDTLKMSDVKRGADANYNVMSMLNIKQLAVNSVADPDGAILALWVPSSLLQDGLDTMKAWGFSHKQTYVWVKTKKEPFKPFIKDIYKFFKKTKDIWSCNISGTMFKKTLDNLSVQNILSFGMGRLFRQTHEICLIGTNNNKIYKKLNNKSQRSVSFGENLKHSAKPEHLQDSLELMFPSANKLELFARRNKKDWTCLGNEVCNGEDITVSLSKLM